MKVGILGGTFDPPHLGHRKLAEAALDSLQLDYVLWIPNAQNPLKKDQPIASSEQRLEMVKLAIEDHPKMAVSDIELTREGPSYMWETLEELRAAQPADDFWLLAGADVLENFMKWHFPERILKVARLGVAIRPGTNRFRLLGIQAEPVQRRIDLIEMEPMDVSASIIRRALAEGLDPDHLSPQVAQYIQNYGLYQERISPQLRG